MTEVRERAEPGQDSVVQKISHEATAQHMRLYDKVDSLCREMFVEKNTQYDNAIVETGVLGAAVEIIGLQRRVRALVLKSTDHGRAEKDALADLLKDLHVYSNIALLMLADDNWSGK